MQQLGTVISSSVNPYHLEFRLHLHIAGWTRGLSHLVHTQEVAGSNPAPATKEPYRSCHFDVARHAFRDLVLFLSCPSFLLGFLPLTSCVLASVLIYFQNVLETKRIKFPASSFYIQTRATSPLVCFFLALCTLSYIFDKNKNFCYNIYRKLKMLLI